jgi:hypothetical protein
MQKYLMLMGSAVFCSLALLACSEQESNANKSKSVKQSTSSASSVQNTLEQKPKLPRAEDFVTDKASFIEKLPSGTMAYARIPSFLDLFAPSGSTLDNAKAHPDHVAVLNKIKLALKEKLLNAESDNPKMMQFLSVMAADLKAPIEVALIKSTPTPEGVALPESMLIYTKLDYAAASQLDDVLSELTDRGFKQMTKQAHGMMGLLAIGSANVYYRFDAATQGVYFVRMSQGTEQQALTLLNTLKPNEHAQVLAAEAKIDQSRRGLFAWVNTYGFSMIDKKLELVKPNDPFLSWVRPVHYVSFGEGVVDGKGKLTLNLDLSSFAMFTRAIPKTPNALSLNAAGEPRFLLGAKLLDSASFQILETLISKSLSSAEQAKYHEFKNQFHKELGFPVSEIPKIVGSELLYFGDQAGEFTALKVLDHERALAIVKHLDKSFDLSYRTYDHQGTTYHAMNVNYDAVYKNLPVKERKDIVDKPELSLFMEFFMDVIYKQSFYWVEKDGYWLIAAVPQVIKDALATTEQVKLNDWLTQSQKQDLAQSNLYVSVSNQMFNQSFYNLYLSMIDGLIDFSGAKTGIVHLPSANEIHLPKQGMYGAQLDLDNQHLTFSLTYDNTAADILLQGGQMTTVLVVGILAALALPQYQDYIVRTQMSRVVGELSVIKTEVETIILEESNSIAKAPLADLVGSGFYSKLLSDESFYSIDVQRGTASIHGILGGEASKAVEGVGVILERSIHGQWSCRVSPATHANFNSAPSGWKPKYIPAICR